MVNPLDQETQPSAQPDEEHEVNISLGFPSASEKSLSSGTPTASSSRRIPSWGVWPGAANLPRLSTGSTSGGPTASVGLKDVLPPFGRGRGVNSRLTTSGQSKEEKQIYQKKDRILFTGRPPALPRFATEINKDEDPWEWLSKHVLLISCLEWWVNDCDVRDAGRNYGDVRAVRVLSNFITGASTGLALIEYTSPSALESAITNKGRAWSNKQQSDAEIHRIPTNLIRSLFSSTDQLPPDIEPHWVYGTWISPDTVASLCSLAQVPFSTPNPELYSTQQASSSHLPDDSRSPDSRAPPSAPHTPRSTAVPQLRTDRPQGERELDLRYESFRFPFAAAAVAASSLLELVKSHREIEERQSKRCRIDERLNDAESSNTTELGNLQKGRSSLPPSTLLADVDYSFIEKIEIPYWPQRMASSLPRLPNLNEELQVRQPSSINEMQPRRPWRMNDSLVHQQSQQYQAIGAATSIPAGSISAGPLPQYITSAATMQLRRPQQQRMWMQGAPPHPGPRHPNAVLDVPPQAYHMDFSRAVMRPKLMSAIDRLSQLAAALPIKHPITTHVLDTTSGVPASDIHVTLECLTSNFATVGITDNDGRINQFESILQFSSEGYIPTGTYKLTFNVGQYFKRKSVPHFFPIIEVTFQANEKQKHLHVPILLSPYGYSTYRGS